MRCGEGGKEGEKKRRKEGGRKEGRKEDRKKERKSLDRNPLKRTLRNCDKDTEALRSWWLLVGEGLGKDSVFLQGLPTGSLTVVQ